MAKTKGIKEESKVKHENSSIEMEKKFNRFLEEAKLTNDYMKHIATLDTGSILIMASFLQKNVQQGAGSLVALAAFCFILSLAGVIVAQDLMTHYVSSSVDDVNRIPSEKSKWFYRIPIWLAYLGFVIGISILGVFIFYNLQNT